MEIKKQQHIKNKIISIFKDDNKVFIDGEISLTHLIDLARKLDEDIINKLLQDSETKNHFFKNISGNYNFLFDKFERFINSELLDNSYTSFKNRIGLTVDNRYIKDSKDIVLNFPFKDCYLEGGQTKDEGEEEYFYKDKDGLKSKKRKRKEIFFNEYIAYDEIDALLSKKAFGNFKKYTKNGTEEVKSFNRNENGIIKDNLIIKGNNLLALHSLYSEFKGKVKLIYIDPPYNTGSDTFTYNDNFNHSAWLVFMKDRLKIAKELLKDDGVIFIQCDDNEQAYLKVLMDEIFGRDNFVSCIIWLNKEGGGKSDSKHFRNKHEYILCYAKNKEILEIYPQEVEDIDRYKFSDKHEATRGKYQLIKLDSGSLGWVKSLDYSIKYRGITFYAGGDKEKWKDRQNGGASVKDWGWRWSKEKLLWGIENDFIEIKQNLNGEWNIYTKQYLNCDNEGNIIPRKLQPMAIIEKHSNTQSNRHMKSLFEKNAFNYSKPEGLVYEIFNIATKEGDLILDFFAGSGTTLAVAHKMNRQYIGVEQIERHFEICIERLKKVIEGEQGGISKKVDWTGGGEFISFEIAQHNEIAKEKIINAKNYEEIKNYFEEICDKFFLRYNLNIKEFEEKIIESEEFKNLDLEKQKEIFISLLDPNQMYINYSNMEDKKYKLNKKDIELTREFYKND